MGLDLIRASIKRPVAIIMIMLIFVILGVVSLNMMEMELIPTIEMPIALMMAQYSGAGPSEVETLVTQILEAAVSGVENVDELYSISSEGMSLLMVQFTYGTDMNVAVNSIRDRVSMVEGAMPEAVETPTILKMDMNALPVVYLSISSPELNQYELRSLAAERIQPLLERQPGVASADLSGGLEKEIRIEIDPERLEGLGLSMSAIAGILMSENTDLPGGAIDYGDRTLTISSKLKLGGVEEVRRVPIVTNQGLMVPLEDIAVITESDKEITSISRYNGEPNITFSITKASDGNTVSTVAAVREEVEQLRQEYDNLNIRIVSDSAAIIEESVRNVVRNIFLGAFLAILVLFIFLRNVGLTGVVAVSMPISIIVTFVLLYFSGTTLNLLSLGGLSIGVGMLVDNSVVVLENIHRYRTQEGCGKIKGTYRGTKEVFGSIFGSTMTTIVIFVPFAFTSGLVNEIFIDMALAVVFSLLASLLVAVTIVPMVAGNYVNNVGRNTAPRWLGFVNWILDLFGKLVDGVQQLYSRILPWTMRHRKMTFLVVAVVLAGCIGLTPLVGTELLPIADEGSIGISIEAPVGSRLEVMNSLAGKVETLLETIPEIESVSTSFGGTSIMGLATGGSGTSGQVNVSLVDKEMRQRSTDDVAEAIRQQTAHIAGATITVSTSSTTADMAGSGILLEIMGDDLGVLEDIANEVMRQLSHIEGMREMESSISGQDQQVAVVLNKDRIRQHGLTGAEVATQIRNTISGTVATTLKTDVGEIDIRIVHPEEAYASYSALGSVSIRTAAGMYIPLSSIAEIGLDAVPGAIYRMSQSRYVQVVGSIYGRDTGSVGRDVQAMLDQMTFPDGYTVSLGGANEMMVETFTNLILVLILAVILVYVVMAAQFETLLNPFIILFTIPLSFIGAMPLLYLTGEPISMTSMIGALVLVGIVVNNGIVLIEFIKIRRERDGMELEEAVLSACPIRLRPILMTALTTILGQMPLIFSQGSNSEMLRGMGMVVAGGLLASTALTLIVVPNLYIVFETFSAKLRGKLKLPPRASILEVEAECN